MKKPLVSIVIPTIKGREKELTRAIRTVQAQTYTNIELIVINQGLPAPEQRNIGIRQAIGKYIAFLDDDDEWDEDKIQLQVGYMETHQNCGLCSCWSHDERFDMERTGKALSNPTFKELLSAMNFGSTSNYMIRSRAKFYFDTKLAAGQEYDLALSLSQYYWDIHCIQQVLMTQHTCKNQISCNWKKKVRGQMQFYKKWHQDFDTPMHVKTIGMMFLFSLGVVFGVKIYKLITIAKEMYE